MVCFFVLRCGDGDGDGDGEVVVIDVVDVFVVFVVFVLYEELMFNQRETSS